MQAESPAEKELDRGAKGAPFIRQGGDSELGTRAAIDAEVFSETRMEQCLTILSTPGRAACLVRASFVHVLLKGYHK